MGRILVIHPQVGLLQLVKQVLTGTYEVEVIQKYDLAITRLDTNEVYEAVLCATEQPGRTNEIFEKASERGQDTRMIPIGSTPTQVAAFCDQWNSNPRHKAANQQIGSAWLPERCTAGQILALLQSTAVQPDTDAPHREAAIETPIPAPGIVVDGYRLLSLVGQGGFGTTWLAENDITGRRVAMKFVEGDEQITQELAALRRYIHVADRTGHLIHIEHVNQDQSRFWYVTPIADSQTGGDTPHAYKPLSLENQLLALGHISELDAAKIALGMVRALSTLHQAGLLHGDVSPHNIFSMHGRWILGDPGLVRFLGQTGICRNRKFYPQPRVDRACHDLSAVGLVLWESVSGVYEMHSGQERLRLDGQMLTFISRKDSATARVICRALAENPEQRYMTADEMLKDLEVLVAKLALKSSAQNSLYDLLRPLRTSSAPPPLE